MDPIAYTYEASEHCPNCAEARFGNSIEGFDDEANPVGAVFSPFEDRDMVCGTCGEIIHEISDDTDYYSTRCDVGNHRLIDSPDTEHAGQVCADCGFDVPQCAYEDGMISYTRCTNPVARDGATYCERHAQYELDECAACGGETSDFQEEEGTHVHACALDCNYHALPDHTTCEMHLAYCECGEPPCNASDELPRCEHIVSGEDPGPYVTCSNPVREQTNAMRRNRIEPKYCEEHDNVRDDSYTDVSVIFEGALDSIETLYDSVSYHAYINKEEDEIREQLDALTAEGLAAHLAAGGCAIEASHHEHEFDSREDYEAWIDQGAECFCESFETLFDSAKEYADKLNSVGA